MTILVLEGNATHQVLAIGIRPYMIHESIEVVINRRGTHRDTNDNLVFPAD